MTSQMSHSLYILPSSHHLVIQWPADSRVLRRSSSNADTSRIELHWVSCCHEVGASFCLTHFVLSPPRAHTHTHIHTAHCSRNLSAVNSLMYAGRWGCTLVGVFYSPWRRPKSLWASVSCFRWSVTETWRRKWKKKKCISHRRIDKEWEEGEPGFLAIFTAVSCAEDYCSSKKHSSW